jgi:transcriptional regulator with XRE-family HTH domain
MSTPQTPPDDSSNERPAKKRARGTVALNPIALRKARLDRDWKQEVLAARADVHKRTVQRAEAGYPIEQKFAEKIAKALGMSVPELLANAPPLAQAQTTAPPPGREKQVIVVDVNADTYDPAELFRMVSNIVEQVRADANTKKQVLLMNIGKSSIRIVLEVDADDADRIFNAFESGALAYLKITSVTLPSRPTPPTSRRYLAALGYLGLGCAILAAIPVIRLPACILGLALSGLGLFLACRRRKQRIVMIVATILNASILAFALYGMFSAEHDAGKDAHRDGDVREDGLPLPNPEGPPKDAEANDGKAKEENPEQPRKPDGEKRDDAKDDELKKAVEKVKDAELKYDETDVVISEMAIAAVLAWGDASLLKPKDFKIQDKLVRRGVTGLTADVHCGTDTGYMGKVEGYAVFVSQAALSGLAIADRKERLVIYVPFGKDGFGTPSVVESRDKDNGLEYISVRGESAVGYYLIKKP